MAARARPQPARHAPDRADCRSSIRPSRSVSAPPASCTKRSAAARSQSWLFGAANVHVERARAPRAPGAAPAKALAARRCDARLDRRKAVERLSRRRSLAPAMPSPRAGCDRRAVERRALPGDREEQFVRHRRDRARPAPGGRARPAPTEIAQSGGRRDRRACRRSDRRSRLRVRVATARGSSSVSSESQPQPGGCASSRSRSKRIDRDIGLADRRGPALDPALELASKGRSASAPASRTAAAS